MGHSFDMDNESWKHRFEQSEKARLEAERALEDTITELEKVRRFKTDFLANVSHELRTPLNSTIILSRVMLDNQAGNLSDEDLHSLSIIHNNANDLLGLIEDMLDMSAMQAGELSVHLEDVSLQELCRNLEERIQPLAVEKSLSFHIEIDDNVSEWINTDRKRLRQILKNLLLNACKFTHPGGKVSLKIDKTVWHVDPEYSSESLRFQVTDTGIGIPDNQKEAIFEMFQQADGSTQRSYEGTGLGLAISARLAELLDGTLSLQSEENVGSTFSLVLPPGTLLPEESEHQATADTPPFFYQPDEEHQLSQYFSDQTVLLVDDDLRNSFALSLLLQKQGLTVLLAENGQQALKVMENEPSINLVLLDVIMPTMNGITMLETLRSQVAYRMMPVIMLTASTSAKDEKRSRIAGADDYLTKPVEISALLDCLQQWLED